MGIAEFDDLLLETITVEPMLTRDSYGACTYGAGVLAPCRIVGGHRLVMGTDGVQRLSTAAIYLGTTPAVGPFDRITLPARFNPNQPPIIHVNLVYDEAAAHHQRVLI